MTKIILQDSEEAAQPYTMTGWTHFKCCHCGEPVKKPYTDCDKLEFERYCALPTAEWDGNSMLYSDTRDQYYGSLDDVYDEIEEGQDISELRLLICKPNYVTPLESNYCCDELADDMDVPAAVEEAMYAFNKAVAGIVLSWSPSNVRLKV